MMADDFESRLRRSLHARAATVTPDPRTWARVQQRVHRRQTVRWAATAGATLAIAAVVAVAGLDLLRPGNRVQFPPAGDPAPAPTSAPTPAPTSAPTASCPQGAPPLVVFAAGGDLVGLCEGAARVDLTTGDALDDAPAYTADGRSVVFERRATPDGDPVLVARGPSGEERELGPGRAPAVAPDGARLAAVVADGGQWRIEVRDLERGVVVGSYPAGPEGTAPVATSAVDDLSWSADSRFLLHETHYENGSVDWITDATTIGDGTAVKGNVLPHDYTEGGQYTGSRLVGDGAVLTVHRCCRMVEGDPFESLEVGLYTHGFSADGFAPGSPRYRRLVGLGGRLSPAVAARAYLARPAGGLRYDPDGGLTRAADATSVLVGDGEVLLSVTADGAVAEVARGVTGVAVNPVVDPGAGLDLPDEGEAGTPQPAEVTVAAQVYFSRVDVTGDCQTTFAWPRQVPPAAPARGALEALLAGPTAQEAAQGATSFFSAQTADLLLDLTIADGTAYADFADFRDLIPNASTSCGSTTLLSQLDNTLRQFPTVQDTRYAIEGDEAAFYEFLQRTPPD